MIYYYLFVFIASGRFGRVIITSKDGNKNMLRAAIWKELRLLDGIIRNITVFYEEEYFRYEDICAKWMSECFQNDILNLDYVIEDVSTKTMLRVLKLELKRVLTIYSNSKIDIIFLAISQRYLKMWNVLMWSNCIFKIVLQFSEFWKRIITIQ